MKLKIVTWNCNGLAKSTKLIKILRKTLLKQKEQFYFILCIQEVRTEFLNYRVIEVLNFYKLSYQFKAANGGSGGMLTIWNRDMQAVEIFKNDACLISKFPEQNTIVINTYIRTKQYFKYCELLNNGLGTLSQEDQTRKIVLLGDLNAYADPHVDRKNEKHAARKYDSHSKIFDKIMTMVNKLSLVDVAKQLNAAELTHYCAKTKTRTRLDYIFCNEVDNSVVIKTEEINCSDHSFLEVTWKNHELDIGSGIWSLNNSILLNNKKSIDSLIYKIPTDPRDYDFGKQNLRDFLRTACIRKHKMERQYGTHLGEELKHAETEREQDHIKEKIETLEQQKCLEIIANIKHVNKEVYGGNPKEVKKWKERVRHDNLIREMKAGDQILTDTDSILEETTKYYKELYKNSKVDNLSRFEGLRYFRKRLSTDESESISGKITQPEIQKAIEKLNPGTSPGPDGLTPELYIKHCEAFKEVFCELFNNLLEGGNIPKSFRGANVRLLPKELGLKSASDYRPISLINIDQKILSHVIAERLKTVLGAIIGKDQFAYLNDRKIHNAIFTIKESLRRNNKNWCTVGIDFSKAFDRVDRKYLMHLLWKINLPENVQTLIRNMYTKTSMNLLINGHLTETINTERGVRQGCPLSALLFILSLEPLFDAMRTHNWFRKPATRRIVAYADDITVFVHKCDLKVLFDKLQKFCEGTQFKMNKSKSIIVCKSKVDGWETHKHMKALGVHMGNEEADDLNHKKLMNILQQAHVNFHPKMSLRGKAIAMKSFVVPKLTHIARHVDIHSTVIKKFHILSRNVLWGNARKPELAIAHLERDTKEGGIGWPNLKSVILAAKTTDIMNMIKSKDETKDLFLSGWQKRDSFKQNLVSEFKSAKITSLKINGNGITSNVLNVSTSSTNQQRSWYKILQNVKTNEFNWKHRIRKSCERFGITKEDLCRGNKWIWKQNELTAFEKNTYFRVLYNNFRDRELLWKIGIKDHPLCYLCEHEFENYEHIFGNCSKIKNDLAKCGIGNLKDLFKYRSVKKAKAVAHVVLGSWLEEADSTCHKLKRLVSDVNL